MDRYLCIHCHFYQPPRENPWLEAIELQESAYPYHDWNERVTAECYGPNSASRILSGDNRIVRIVNNYSRISFNFGATLISWLADHAPDVYEAILAADRESQERFSGHGNAMAQVYNHMIMPLANRRDKWTQVIWGIKDFQYRFRRNPEGMWLAETAVDVETLEALADNGIQFTVLAPSQARNERRIGQPKFKSVEGVNIDPSRAYVCNLPSGRSLHLFFYDGPISQAVAFEGLLSNGENFANRLLSGFSDHRPWPQLMHIATDGETYGHHHKKGEMALAYALHHIECNNLAKLTNYGEYLEKHPPTHEVEILENTAWSCAHGVGRWARDCGCNSGRAGWNQGWREPLRGALDQLRDALAVPYERTASQYLRDPWKARDHYAEVMLNRNHRTLQAFFEEHCRRELTEAEIVSVLSLLEMQRHLMLMYTSCGWFFDELSGLETVQVIMYAGRALQLAEGLLDGPYAASFVERLGRAHSNLSRHGNGARIFEHCVKPAQLDLLDVAAHYAIASMFRETAGPSVIASYEVKPRDEMRMESGRARLALGSALVRSRVTHAQEEVSFGVLHFGDHNLTAGVRTFRGEQEYHQVAHDLKESFDAADLPAVLRLLDRHFAGATYSLKALFRDERQRVVNQLLSTTMSEAEAAYRQIYQHHAPLMGFLSGVGAPLPKMLHQTAEFVLNTALRKEFLSENMDLERIQTLLDTAARAKIQWDVAGLAYALNRRLGSMADELAVNPREERLRSFNAAVEMVKSLPFEVDLARVQNVFYQLSQSVYPIVGLEEDDLSRAWIEQFLALGEKLGICVSPIAVSPGQPAELPS
jgi:alpha-amylase/alpha-mannosidase (GH57 family)